MSELVKMSSQFSGLPMENLIGAPLTAACDAQVMLARATQDFISEVGFETQVDDKGNSNARLRMVNFTFSKPEQRQQSDGSVAIESAQYSLDVPFLAIVAVPTLQIQEVDVNFAMEVKSSFQEASKTDRAASFSAEGQGTVGNLIWSVTASVKVEGSVAASREVQRKSDNSARYFVSVQARQKGTPEGLSRVMDILQQSIAPVPAS